MIDFFLRYRRLAFFVLLVFLIVIVRFSGLISFPSLPVMLAGTAGNIVDRFVNLPSWLFDSDSISERKDSLKIEVGKLKVAETSYRTFIEENKRLKELLDIPYEKELEPVGAKVLMGGIASYSRRIFINRGSVDGIKEGLPVIFEDKIAGKIVKVAKHVSLVNLINHPEIAVDVVVPRTGTRGIFSGGIACRVKYVDRDQDIVVGDELYSSGRGGVFPAGFRVGIVDSVVSEEAGVFQIVKAVPVADFKKMDFVFIVKAPNIAEVKEISEE